MPADQKLSTENEQALALQEARLKDQLDEKQKTAAGPAVKKISNFEAGIMLAVAGASDLLDYLVVGSIPLIGDILDIIVWLAITAWVMMRGLDKPPMFLAAGGIELIPIIGDLLPTYILMVVVIILYNNSSRFRTALSFQNV
jgi:hypothetical protein